MNDVRFYRASSGLACFALATSLLACDAIIGIEELQVKPVDPPANGVTCTTPADCAPPTNPCFVRACTSAGICELRDVEPGAAVEMQVPGDCISIVCQGGAATDAFDASDFPEDGNPCTQESCVEGVGFQQGPAAAGTDCGGLVCDGAGSCVECNGVDDCALTQLCLQNTCVAGTCDDDVESGNETDVDCGGGCLPCGNDLDCDVDADCESSVCEGTCQAPSCNDNTQNGDETDVDCGGSCPLGCGLDETCVEASDCTPQLNFCVCEEASCTCRPPECDDGIQNGTELDVDCGPQCSMAHSCDTGMPCQTDDWCQSFVCDLLEQKCLKATCSDGVQNGDELLGGGVDCWCGVPIPGCSECSLDC